MQVKAKSLFIPVAQETLHLKRIYSHENGIPIFMLHGAVENGKIFYSHDFKKGLAPYLAQQGYDVFVADLRGRGESQPSISRKSTFDQRDSIIEDIPAFINKIREIKGKQKQHWIAHSWGGVLMNAFLARHPEESHKIHSITCFGSKRTVKVKNWHRYLIVELGWVVLPFLLTRLYGYLPARKYKMGSDNESIRSHADSKYWVYNEPWLDPTDQFDYKQALEKNELPPALYLTGIKDLSMGHPHDVQDFMRETQNSKAKFKLLSRKNGNKQNYDHINILTHPDAENDHFLKILDWLQELELKSPFNAC